MPRRVASKVQVAPHSKSKAPKSTADPTASTRKNKHHHQNSSERRHQKKKARKEKSPSLPRNPHPTILGGAVLWSALPPEPEVIEIDSFVQDEQFVQGLAKKLPETSGERSAAEYLLGITKDRSALGTYSTPGQSGSTGVGKTGSSIDLFAEALASPAVSTATPAMLPTNSPTLIDPTLTAQLQVCSDLVMQTLQGIGDNQLDQWSVILGEAPGELTIQKLLQLLRGRK